MRPAESCRQQRRAVGPKTIDDFFIPEFPQIIAKPLGGFDEQPVIQLVKIPFIEQETIKRAARRKQCAREFP